MAKVIKKEFDATYGGVWHCVVGRNFGSLVTHETKTFIYFYLGQVAVRTTQTMRQHSHTHTHKSQAVEPRHSSDLSFVLAAPVAVV